MRSRLSLSAWAGRSIANCIALSSTLLAAGFVVLLGALSYFLNRHLTIIYMTAYTDDATIAKAESRGGYGYMRKPFQKREIPDMVTRALDRHRHDSGFR
jgi:DNA-binding NtrC family response regulator